MFKITFQATSTHEAEVDQETTLLAAAAKGGASLTHRCGGHARCGSCRVTVVEGADQLSEIGSAEGRVLKVLKAGPDERLACQAWARGEVCCRVG